MVIAVGAEPQKWRIGWISYWNCHPFLAELEARGGLLDLWKAPPSQVNLWFRQGKLHMAPCSSVCFLHSLPQYRPLPLGIAASGPVLSVYLGFQTQHQAFMDCFQERLASLAGLFLRARELFPEHPWEQSCWLWRESAGRFRELPLKEIPRIYLHRSSAASRTLVRILLRMTLGDRSYLCLEERDFQEKDPPQDSVELVIGDEALKRSKRDFHRILDLGTLWQGISQLPFTFALWQAREDMPEPWIRGFIQLAVQAQARMHLDPARYLPMDLPRDSGGEALPLKRYWSHIRYGLVSKDIAGLQLFLSLARHLWKGPLDQSLFLKKLQQLSELRPPH